MTRILAPALLASLLGCATPAPTPPAAAETVSIHQSVVSAPPRYEIVKRVSTESWRSLFWTPTYDSSKKRWRRSAARPKASAPMA